MILDCHTHIGRNEHINASVDELLQSMDEAKIDQSLVFAGKLNDVDNEYLMSQIRHHDDRLYGVLCYHPGDIADDVENFIDNEQVVAVKFYLGYDHWFPNDDDIADVLELLDKKKKAAIFHCGDCLNSVKKAKLKYSHPLGIDDPAVEYPDVKMVIAHMGYPWHRDTAEVCYKNDNVFTDISGFVYGKFDQADQVKFCKVLNEFTDIASDEKLLFGSDWPISNQESYVKTASVLNDFRSLDARSKLAKRVFNIRN